MKYHFLHIALVVSIGACSTTPSDPGLPAYPDIAPPVLPPLTSQPVIASQSETASLWTTAPNSLLSMRRAKDVGDLLTVVVDMNDQASVQTSLSRTQGAQQDASLNALFGLPEWSQGVLPGGAGLSPAIDVERNATLNGNGAVNRAEQVEFRLAVRVVGVETNGNLVIQGVQRTQVSDEVRYLQVSGVIRAQDVTRDNTVSYDQIAEAQLTYVSDGEATRPVRQRVGSDVLETLFPF